MKVWKDKEGKKLTSTEFIERWKSGIEGITPAQKLKTQIMGTRISLIGILLGLFVSIYGYKHLWWVGIILLGALINTGIQYLGLVQQMKVFEDIEKQLKEEEKELMVNDGKEVGMSAMGINIEKLLEDSDTNERRLE